jgi:hypothetical protein
VAAWIDVSNAPSALSVSVTTQAYEYNATAGDTVIVGTDTFNVNLPPAGDVTGKIYYIKNTGPGTVTVVPDGVETIDGNSDVPVVSGNCLTIVSDGLTWLILGFYFEGA